jgi:exodeoxyribonuclease VIII
MTDLRLLITPEPGIYRDVPMEVYHRWNAASNSRLTKLDRSPAHLKAYLDQPSEDSKALRVGRAIHTTVLEPDTFDRTFVVTTKCLGTTQSGARCDKNGRDYFGAMYGWRCGIHQKGLGTPDETQLPLSEDEYQMAMAVRRAVQRHRSASGLLSGAGDTELSLVWRHSVTGVLCKARPDRFSPWLPDGAIVDLKSTRDASYLAFAKAIFSYGYHRQASLYLDGARVLGLEAAHFVFAALEKEAPYAVATYRLLESAIEAGAEQLVRRLNVYDECMQSNVWPAYPDEVQDIALPDYAWKMIEEEVGQ